MAFGGASMIHANNVRDLGHTSDLACCHNEVEYEMTRFSRLGTSFYKSHFEDEAIKYSSKMSNG